MSELLYIVLVTDEDGTETALGPWSKAEAMSRVAALNVAFPQATARWLPLLTMT